MTLEKYYPDELVAHYTRLIVDRGETLLQIFRLAEREEDHARMLATEMRFKPGQTVIDAGCGTGALASYLWKLEPTLRFNLLNISAAQLAYADERFSKQVGDIEHMPYEDGCADGVILSYVLGHTDLGLAISEAHRALRPGGWLFIYDIVATGPLDPASEALRYNIRPAGELVAAVETAGFECTRSSRPTRDFVSNVVRESFTAEEFERVFHNVAPICVRFEKNREAAALARDNAERI